MNVAAVQALAGVAASTTSRERRPENELAREPKAGFGLQLRTQVPGLPAHFVQL